MTERWLPVLGYEGRYEVSDRGRVRALFAARGRRTPRLVGSKGGGVEDYRQVGLTDVLGRRRTRRIHTLVLEAFVGPCPQGMEARHANGDPTDASLANLTWATHVENESDKRLHGTAHAARRHHRLTPALVHEVRELGKRGIDLSVLAARFGASEGCIYDVLAGRTWGWLA